MKPNPVMTHGIAGGLKEPKDAVSKDIEIVRFDNELYAIRFTTLWEEGQEPTITKLTLSGESMQLLQEVSTTFLHCLNEYKFETDKPNPTITKP